MAGDGRPVAGDRMFAVPAPSGPHEVGSTTLHLVDETRPDPWNPGRPRELMITVTYPAAPDAGTPLARYLSSDFPPAAVRSIAAEAGLPIDVETLPGLWTHAHRGAPIDSTPERSLPVILYSPGVGVPRMFGTSLVEDLASRGYVVVSVDHTYDAQVVEFPDGRLEVAAMPTGPEEPGEWGRKALDARVADSEFVLDELADVAGGGNPAAEGRPLPDGLGRALDLSRVGMFGHSLGGVTTTEVMRRDARVAAGVSLDGSVGSDSGPGAAPTAGSDRPIMLMSSRSLSAGEPDTYWNALWDKSSGWKRQLELSGAGHYSFTDVPGLLPPIPASIAAEVAGPYLGTISSARADEIVRTYVAAMFDRFLRDQPAPLLDCSDEAFPEVRYVR
ncbi:alpha/beta hydrolase family protein [Rhodococcus sp. SGAir0479]|uniref:alpha/beta hydrolase family protein n=1 Tax=Rhodococcus sp. SGAir0479 TaxID=2567884 RepID=UPI001585FB98|nr:hydrolase [Rhodococcus sp. SGAir0479]